MHDQFLSSLQSFMGKLYDELISKVTADAQKVLQIPTNPNVFFLVTNQEQADHHEQRLKKEHNHDQLPPILFAVAGSGKTQSIFNFMAKNLGHYLVSGRISDSLAHQDSILSPRRGGASADTQWLHELWERPKMKRLESKRGYLSAISKLLCNRQMLMEAWVKSTNTNSSNGHSIYWLLLQTACTPKFDPFVETLKLLMFSVGSYYQPPTENQRTLENLPTIIDEAQNELDPFWDDQIPLVDFMEAVWELGNLFSISGTSLRIKDCRKVVSDAAIYVTLPQPFEHQISSLLRVFRFLIRPQELSRFTENLIHRVLEHYNSGPREQQLSDLLQGTDLKKMLGDFHFTEALRKAEFAKNESMRKLLEDSKTFLIPILGLIYQRDIYEVYMREKNGSIENESIENSLRIIFKDYNQRRWWQVPGDAFVDAATNDSGSDLEVLLLEEFMPSSLADTSDLALNLVSSDQGFSALFGVHIQRLLRKIAYFCSLGPDTFEYEFWRIACPETMVFQSTEDADGRETFFQQAKDLLRKHVNAESRVASEWQFAADKVAGEFRQAFEEKDDRSAETRRCRITRYSALFRGRIRWSTVYIEHVFASYLKTMVVETQTSSTSRYNSTDTHTGGTVQTDPSIPGFAAEGEPMFETVTNLTSSEKPFRIEQIAKDAAELIKSSLKGRIRQLQSNGHHILLRDLYFTAVRADLMHRPSIYPRDTSARMITEGFALLDPAEPRHAGSTYAPKQKLSEPIVVDAVTEYLRDRESDDEDNLENVLRNFLFDSQDDASSFGKAAEYYFAWVRAPNS